MSAYCILNQEKPEQVTLGCLLHQATGNYCRCCTDYQAGKIKPAYPVPAIPIKIEYDWYYLCMMECNHTWSKVVHYVSSY